MLRTAVSLARLVSALLLLGVGLFAASFYASNAPGGHKNPSGEVAPGASAAFTIVTLSDLKARSGVLLEAYEDAAKVKADALVIGGDLVVQNSDFEYRYASRLLARAPEGAPVFVTIGNHELWDRHDHSSPRRYEEWFGPTQSWFRTKGVLFVSLDTADYHFTKERDLAVRAILAEERPRSRACVLLSHILPQEGTPLADKRGNEKQLSKEESKRILAIVEDHQVDLLLGGHYHGYATSSFGRATLLLTGGGGATLDGTSEFFHYLEVTIAPTGAVTHTVVRVASPFGVEWLRYQLLRFALPVLGVLAGLLVVTSLAARWLKAKAPPPAEKPPEEKAPA